MVRHEKRLTEKEIAAFYESSNYTPATAIVSSNANGSRFLKELDDFYNGDFSVSVMGGFCALFDNIFGVINGFFDLIGSVQGLIDDAISHISLLAIDKEGTISTHFQAIQSEILVNPFHMTNVLVNILENALKYSEGKPKIDVSLFTLLHQLSDHVLRLRYCHTVTRNNNHRGGRIK